MPAEFIALLLGLFGRYRHGCDLPEPFTQFSFHPWAFEGTYYHLAWPSNFLTRSYISQRLRVIEPFINPFRHTLVQPISPRPANKVFGKERKK